MTSVNIALTGAGVIGKRHLKALQSIENINLVAIADPFPQAQETAQEYDVPLFESTAQMLDTIRPDGVIVATPTEHHSEPTLTALEGGAHVLVEKPIMATLAECRHAVEVSDRTGKHVLVGHHRRYYDLVNKAREMVQGGELGQLVSVCGQWNVRKPPEYYAADWRKKWQAGPILTNLIHEMDLLRYIAGDIHSISAETSNAVLGYEKEDAAALIMRFKNNALGTFMLSDQGHSPWSWEQATGENAAMPKSAQNVISFIGTKGSLEFPNLKAWKSEKPGGNWNTPIAATSLGGELQDAYINQLNHFAAVIKGTTAPRIDAQDATDTLRATLAVYEAAQTGCRVML